MYVARLTPDLDVLKEIRALPTELLPKFGQYVDEVVEPALNKDVQDLLVPYPPPRGPGKFTWSPDYQADQRARRWYYANFRGRMPYQRSNHLADMWRVKFDRRQNKGYATVRNTADEAIYVIGKRRAISHGTQGWAADFPEKEERIRLHLTDLLIEGWYKVGFEDLGKP
jgi:hypothetical protein